MTIQRKIVKEELYVRGKPKLYGKFDDIIDDLKEYINFLEKYKEEGWEGIDIYGPLYKFREETDEEYEKRVKRIEKAKEREMKKRLEKYEKLKKEFE